MKQVIRTCMAGLAIAGALVSGAAFAQSQQAAVDANGRLRAPTVEERAALSAKQAQLDAQQTSRLRAAGALRPSTEADALKTIRSSKRGQFVQVPDSLTSSLVAKQAADGHLVIEHQGDVDATVNKAPEAIR